MTERAHGVQVGAHKFRPLGRLLRRDDCLHCFAEKDRHPTRGYTRARPIPYRQTTLRFALAMLAIVAVLATVLVVATTGGAATPSPTYQGKSAQWWAKRAVQARKDANARGRTIERLQGSMKLESAGWFDWLRGAYCVQSHETPPPFPDWRTRTGNGYYGGMQADLDFQRTYGSAYYRRWGTADHWPVWAQLHMAYRGWLARGWHPWPKTARDCGLL